MDTFQNKLAQYLSEEDNAEVQLAAKIGKTQASVNRYRHGKRFPDAATARQIDAATDGAVPFSAWEADFLARAGVGAPA